ncbi:hypothetical protein B0H13DRAFT_2276919 [Mycena leptocephala]|nr:hypothetical protein B0H13DRAFT_2276919 [Mycena leptocephala]
MHKGALSIGISQIMISITPPVYRCPVNLNSQMHSVFVGYDYWQTWGTRNLVQVHLTLFNNPSLCARLFTVGLDAGTFHRNTPDCSQIARVILIRAKLTFRSVLWFNEVTFVLWHLFQALTQEASATAYGSISGKRLCAAYGPLMCGLWYFAL